MNEEKYTLENNLKTEYISPELTGDIDGDGTPDRIDSQYNTPDELYSDENGCRYALTDEEGAEIVKETIDGAASVITDDGKSIVKYPASAEESVNEIVKYVGSKSMNPSR